MFPEEEKEKVNVIKEDSEDTDSSYNSEEEEEEEEKRFDLGSFVCCSDPKFLYIAGKLAYKGKIMYDEGI